MKYIITYIICTFVSVQTLTGQIKSVGLPLIQNISAEQTGGGTQNWDMVQDSEGSIYVANNEGVLRFDGEDWNLFPVRNKSIVRSLCLGDNDRIYVGAYTEIGYLQKDSSGTTTYTSLNHLIPNELRTFDDVWKIYRTSRGILFQSYEYLFIYNDDTIEVVQPETRFGFSYFVDSVYYVVEKEIGLRAYSDGQWKTLSENSLFTEDEIRFILPHISDQLLIGTFSNGLYLLDDTGIQPWGREINRPALEHKLYSGVVTNGQYIFGTVNNGVFITDRKGNITQHLNRSKGLQNNTILSMYYDRQENLWLGLDNGIDYLKTSLPISLINYNFNIETVYASIVFQDKLYVGTNQGLFVKEMEELTDPMDIEFEMVTNSEGQVWCLQNIGGELLCGHNRGAFRIEQERAVRIDNTRGTWNFFRMEGYPDLLFSGTYDGISIFRIGSDGHWRLKNTVKGLGFSARKVISQGNTIWISHDYEGLYKIELSADLDSVKLVKNYGNEEGITGTLPFMIHTLKNEFFVSTSSGFFVYKSDTDRFVPSEEIPLFFNGIDKLNYLHHDERGNYWYFTPDKMGVYRLLEDGTYTNIFTPFLSVSNVLISTYDNIYTYDFENTFIGTVRGLIHFDPSVTKDYFPPTRTFIKEVRFSSNGRDSLWTSKGNGHLEKEIAEEQYRVKYQWNTLSFTYHCTDLENAGNIQYSYRLRGFDKEWSEWDPANQKEFNNLPDGHYTFEVKARNIYNNESDTDRFTFVIETPFYRSGRALAMYISLLLIMAISAAYLVRRRIEKVRTHEKEKHTAAFQIKEQKLTEERLSAEREVEKLRIEKLRADMKHKNKELANTTYYIIHKNQFLNSMKLELSKLSKKAKSDFVEQELKKISRKIDRDIQNEQNWAVFDRYFDEVHQEFLARLKEKHPDLSPKELRLSAYLRMNISTKEIAPLMNISIRGVEISRYRLRKKLELDRTVNLTQYLMEI